jgi:hypothetical protein
MKVTILHHFEIEQELEVPEGLTEEQAQRWIQDAVTIVNPAQHESTWLGTTVLQENGEEVLTIVD